MKKLLILSPPVPLSADEARHVKDEIARFLARGNDVETLILQGEWGREVIEGDDIEIALRDHVLRDDDARLLRTVVEVIQADGTRKRIRGRIERMDGEPAPGELLGTFEEVPEAKPIPRREPGFGSDG